MNQSDLAKFHGVSRKTITVRRAHGWLIMAGDDIDVEDAKRQQRALSKNCYPPGKKAAGNKQGNKTGNSSSGNKSGNKKL